MNFTIFAHHDSTRRVMPIRFRNTRVYIYNNILYYNDKYISTDAENGPKQYYDDYIIRLWRRIFTEKNPRAYIIIK